MIYIYILLGLDCVQMDDCFQDGAKCLTCWNPDKFSTQSMTQTFLRQFSLSGLPPVDCTLFSTHSLHSQCTSEF